ncbi:MAG: hypothetical protein KDD62_16115 [Bdellovibrionales bacterium]|nr:hypothetical protein [Bdellovibrionales bacterium]
MSEYQYFEFQAVDWSLGEKQIEELRKYSGRAAITSTSFVNEYHYGDFKGDSLKWMQKYFDGFFYFANWGTRELFLRFPKAAIESKLIEQYCSGEVFDLVETDSHSIVCFSVDEIDSDQLWESDEGTLSDFLKLRSAVLENEDYRVFFKF